MRSRVYPKWAMVKSGMTILYGKINPDPWTISPVAGEKHDISPGDF
jgi:hypothetical protein